MSLATVHFDIGVASRDRGDLLEAERCFRSALRCDPTFSLARSTLDALVPSLVNWGAEAQHSGNLAAAEQHYRVALEIDRACAAARANLLALAYHYFNDGVSRTNQGDLDGAIACYRSALACGFAKVGAPLNLAQLLMERQCFAEAVPALRRAIEAEPADPVLWRMLARACEESGDRGAAIDALRQARRHGDDDPGLDRHMAALLHHSGEDGAALALLDALLARVPRHDLAAADRLRLLVGLGRGEEALALGGAAASPSDVDWSLIDAYADLLERSGRVDTALAYLRALPGDHADWAKIAGRLELLLHRSGRFEEAIAVNDTAFARWTARLEDEARAAADRNIALFELERFLGRHRAVAAAQAIFPRYEDLDHRDRAFSIQAHLSNGTFAWPPDSELDRVRDGIARSRAVLAAPAVLKRRKRLVTLMMVRDEIDLLADMVACHLNQGADLVLVTDNGSTDGSRELLADLERRAPLQVIDEPNHNHDQALWMSRMLHLARDQHGADWAICADTDEAWLAADGDLPAAIAADAASYGAETGILLCQQSLVMPDRAGIDKADSRKTDARMALTRPLRRIPTTLPLERTHYGALYKAIVRPERALAIWHGNHYAFCDGLVRFGYASRVEILHFHVRSREQLRRKFRRNYAAMSRNPDWFQGRNADEPPPDFDAMADAAIDPVSYPTPFLEQMRRAGRLVADDRVAGLRDRTLPPRAAEEGDPDAVRREAARYIEAIEPFLPRVGVIR